MVRDEILQHVTPAIGAVVASNSDGGWDLFSAFNLVGMSKFTCISLIISLVIIIILLGFFEYKSRRK